MYRFPDQLTPDDAPAIAAQVQIEMLETGLAVMQLPPDTAPA